MAITNLISDGMLDVKIIAKPYNTISTVLKTKHDIVKNPIQNIRWRSPTILILVYLTCLFSERILHTF